MAGSRPFLIAQSFRFFAIALETQRVVKPSLTLQQSYVEFRVIYGPVEIDIRRIHCYWLSIVADVRSNEKESAGPESPVRKKILIVNAFFDDLRKYSPGPGSVPQSMAPVFLAGAFQREHCEVRIYNEHASGPIAQEKLLKWPDMLVMTGLTQAFDRMLHWAAYVRSRNPRVIVVAGGPAVRALPNYAGRFFDYVCLGSVDEMLDVIDEAFGPVYRARDPAPRYELVRQRPWLGFVESSRYCNFRCAFCSLTGEGARYEKYDLSSVRQQIVAQGRKYHLAFIDNNFYGNDRKYFLSRLEMLKELRDEGYFQTWSALVTEDFFAHKDNLGLVRESGCEALFSGVESFDEDSLHTFNKRQNTVRSQIDLIHDCLEHGIVFLYGLIFDLSRRRVEHVRSEIEDILATPGLPLPSYCRLAIPLIGTPYFQECVSDQNLLPKTRLRDLDCLTLAVKPLDSLEQAAHFVRDIRIMRGYRMKIANKALQLSMNYRKQFGFAQKLGVVTSAALLGAPNLRKGFSRRSNRQQSRTYVSSTEYLDPIYKPRFKVAAQYAGYFKPTMVTDPAGALSDEILEDYQLSGVRRLSRTVTELSNIIPSQETTE